MRSLYNHSGPIVDLWWMEIWQWYGWTSADHRFLFSFVYTTCCNFGSFIFQFGLVVQVSGPFFYKVGIFVPFVPWKSWYWFGFVYELVWFGFGLIGFVLIWFLFGSILINDKIPIEFFRPEKSYGSDTM